MNPIHMTWLDLYNHLHKQANDIVNVGNFPWQEQVEVFDWGTLDYYPIDFLQTLPDDRLSFAIDTTLESEATNGS